MDKIFENLYENVSEACFEDIVSMVEELLNETKKANKEAHQEVIFKKLNPEGKTVNVGYSGLDAEGKEAAKKLTNRTHDTKYGVIGKTHSMKDYRKLWNTDSKKNRREIPDDLDSILSDPDEANIGRSIAAINVRSALGRDGKFSKD